MLRALRRPGGDTAPPEVRPLNEELAAIYREDQEDRQHYDPARCIPRDEQRLKRVQELLAAGTVRTAEDHFHAAMVFQHGRRPEHYLQAHELAKRAAELGDRRGRWLAAAALDRWLMNQGRPQKYGTQYRAVNGRWGLWEVDPQTTDAERAEWDVPSLETARRRAKEMNRTSPPPRPRTEV